MAKNEVDDDESWNNFFVLVVTSQENRMLERDTLPAFNCILLKFSHGHKILLYRLARETTDASMMK